MNKIAIFYDYEHKELIKNIRGNFIKEIRNRKIKLEQKSKGYIQINNIGIYFINNGQSTKNFFNNKHDYFIDKYYEIMDDITKENRIKVKDISNIKASKFDYLVLFDFLEQIEKEEKRIEYEKVLIEFKNYINNSKTHYLSKFEINKIIKSLEIKYSNKKER